MQKITVVKPLFGYTHFPPKMDSKAHLLENEVIFEDRAKQQIIDVVDENHIVTFEMTYYGKNTRQVRFEEGEFSKDELRLYSGMFKFDLVPHKYHPDILMGSLGYVDSVYDMTCYGQITNKNGKSYLLIYASRGETDFEDNIIYVHGIWQVEINDSFRNKLFPVTR